MIEAGIANRPVLTLVMDEFAGGQEGTLHFHYLRAINGGLLHEASSLDAHVTQVAQALQGRLGGEQARRFVERFVRPRGLDVPAAPIMADEIERAARLPKQPQRPALWHLPVRLCIQAGLRLYRALTSS
jgi:hypothetical protein